MAARKNYSFEKNQRARAKAAKREAKREQKQARKRDDAGTPGENGDAPASVDTGVAGDGADAPVRDAE